MKQITIVAEERLGIVAEISEELAAADINIETIDAQSYGPNAVISLSVDRYDRALRVINNIPGLRAISEDAILLRLKDEPGALAKISRRFSDAGIGMRSIRFIQRDDEYALVAISAERTEDALALVQDVLVS